MKKRRFCGDFQQTWKFFFFFDFGRSCVPEVTLWRGALKILVKLRILRISGQICPQFCRYLSKRSSTYVLLLILLLLKSAVLKNFRKFQTKYCWRIASVFVLKKKHFSAVSVTLCNRSNFGGNYANLDLACLVTNSLVETKMRKEVIV